MRPDPVWNDTRLPYPAGQSVHGVVSRVAAERPDAVALIDGAERTTYRELERASDAYGYLLRGAGVRPGDVVPVLLPRSTELVVVILGLLKAGAAYAVLDERWSDARLGEVVAELGAGLLVGGDRPAGVPVQRWTPPGVHAAGRPDGFVPAEVAGGDPCCVFVTSGTTGRPKAVLSPHRATVRLFRPGASFALFDERTVKPLAAPPPWDGFTLELWSVLLNGGTSVVVREPYLTPEVLRWGVREHGVNTVFLSSGLFNLFVDEDLGAFEGVRQVMSGGERLSVPHVREFLGRYPDVPLVNGYGPVESTVVVTAHRIVPADCERPDGVPIGRPVPDTAVHVLDETRPCAVGERGELCVSGDGLALGYLGSPGLTAERFPVVEIDGEPTRIYRTGDLARWDEDGVLHYLGRIDRQVKIRGHRVEPAEVERQIEQILGVRRCVALPRRGPHDAVGGLVAFCVPATPGDRLPGALGTLREVLVHYHLPDAVVSVDAIPLTARGKVDETALLALLDTATLDTVTPGLAPAGPGRSAGPDDPLTALVARVYAEVLGRPAVPAGVAFDELGGSSLDAGRVCARLTTELRRPVPVARLLDLRTAQALACWLREQPAAPLPEGEADGAVPLTPVQANFLARHLRDPDDRTAHCVGVWLADGPVDAEALAGAAAETHRQHEALRAEYRGGDVPVARAGGVPAPRPVILPEAATEAAAVEAVRAALEGPLDVTRGRVWRLALAPVCGGGAAIGYVVHHIAFDGWSEAVLARDLSRAYASIVRGGGGRERPPAAALARARALWDAQRADAAEMAALLAGRVAELRGTPELPLPAGPAAGRDLPPDRVEHTLPAEAAAAVPKAAAAEGCSEFTVLLAGYARALSATTGQNDLAVVVPVAQRLDREMERAVGCHVNMVCVRFRNAARVTVAKAVPLVRAALAAQYVEFGELIGELRAAMPGRPPHAPVFQTNFAYQNVAPAALDLPGVRTRLFRPPYQGLSTPLQTEVWPDADGGLRLVVNFLPGTVDGGYAARLADALAGELASAATW